MTDLQALDVESVLECGQGLVDSSSLAMDELGARIGQTWPLPGINSCYSSARICKQESARFAD